MVIGIFGESCTGKSTLADKLSQGLEAQVYTGKDYLRLAKNQQIAKKLFEERLREAVKGPDLIYVISEKEHLSLLPEGSVRVLVSADLELIRERFAKRMRGILPPPVGEMLARNHGMFDGEPHDYHIHNSQNVDEICRQILAMGQKEGISHV